MDRKTGSRQEGKWFLVLGFRDRNRNRLIMGWIDLIRVIRVIRGLFLGLAVGSSLLAVECWLWLLNVSQAGTKCLPITATSPLATY